MLWFVVVAYVVISPVVCLLIGRAIRVREVERPVEVEVAPAAPDPVMAVAAEPAPVAAPAQVDLHPIRDVTGRTPRALRPRWQQGALRGLGL